MTLQCIPFPFSICQVNDTADIDFTVPFTFYGGTDGELSLVCPTQSVPAAAVRREDGWRALRVDGKLDFSMVGVLSGISGVLAANSIGIFAVSTYDTDYILTRDADFTRALSCLANAGYHVEA